MRPLLNAVVPSIKHVQCDRSHKVALPSTRRIRGPIVRGRPSDLNKIAYPGFRVDVHRLRGPWRLVLLWSSLALGDPPITELRVQLRCELGRFDITDDNHRHSLGTTKDAIKARQLLRSYRIDTLSIANGRPQFLIEGGISEID
jgi:hypothetical protein